ncbi:MAG: hypothetical protein K9M13_01260, partial [Simkaniaceae bacterium]|nr:hypothetical protein [Simkaniaceae bacterium]
MKIHVIESYQANSHLTLIGDISLFVNGRLDDKAMIACDSHDFKYAFGGASFENVANIGESIIINQAMYISRIPEKKGLKCFARKGAFDCFFIVGVSPLEKPDALLEVESDQESLQCLFDELLKQYPEGFFIAGEALFDSLEGLYVKKVPMEKTPVFEQKELYIGSERHRSILGILTGLVFPKDSNLLNNSDLNRVFYSSPFDCQELKIFSHTHVALINERNRGPIELDRDITGVRHLLPQ